MSVPLNAQDYERFKKLAEAIMESGSGEISIYTGSDKNRAGGSYAHIEMRTSKLPAEKLEEIFSCPSLPVAPEPVNRASDDY